MLKRSCIRTGLFFVLVLAYQISFSEILKFEHFSNKEGFNQNTINAIVEDKYGFLWFGTPNGLIKYDGYDFFNFNHDPFVDNTIPNNYIQCLFADAEGNLWIGTRAGVTVYIPRLERFFSVPVYSQLYTEKIIADPRGNIWIAGSKALFRCELVCVDDHISFKVSDNFFSDAKSPASAANICFPNERSMLFSGHRGLHGAEFEADSPVDKVRFTSIQDYPAFKNLELTAIHKDENVFWIGTNKGLFKTIIDGGRIRIMEQFELTTWNKRVLSDLHVLSIFEDKEGCIWIGSTNEGIFKYLPQTDSFENYGFNPKNENGISSPRINCFFQDRFGVIWIGTAQGGINKLDVRQKQFVGYRNNPFDRTSVSGNLVNSILEDSKGYVWVASYNGPVCKSLTPITGNTIGELRFSCFQDQWEQASKNDFINVIFEDDKGFVWFGGSESVSVVDPRSNKRKTIEFEKDGENIPFDLCRVVTQIDSNTMLFGGDKLVVVENPWEAVRKQNPPKISADCVWQELSKIQALAKHRNGMLWVGTLEGLYVIKYNNRRFEALQSFSTENDEKLNLSHKNIFSLYCDKAGHVWVGTFGGGLNKLTLDEKGMPREVKYYRKNGLLPDDAIYGIVQEDDDRIWLSTDMGLCRMNTSNNTIDIFDVRDGLINNNFRQGAYHKGKSGLFYFGGLNGLTVFDPQSIRLNKVAPISRITGLSINNNPIKIGEKLTGGLVFDNSLLELNPLTIGHKAKIVSFHLTAQHSTSPAKNRLAYMLEGFNNEWIEVNSGKATVTYTNLPADDYVLRVKSANGDGVWTDQTTNLNISVLPPWYKTWWSLSLFFVVVAFLVFGVSVYFVNHEKLKQRLKYEQIDKQRIDSVNQGKLRFFTNVSHEFRTPLTLILGPLEQLLKRNTDPASVRYIKTIQNNTRRLLSLVDQLITFRKAEQGHLSLNLTSDALGHFIYPAAEAFEEYAIQKNINFFYKINSPNEPVVLDIEKTERIIFNLLSNSFRYTPEHGNISIEADVVFQDNTKMTSIKVIDTGKGIPENKREKIFERFYQLEGRTENVGGTGIGLAFCKSLIDLMGGTISVESEPGVRTCFSIIIPSVPLQKGAEELRAQSFIKDWIPVNINADKEQTNWSAENSGAETVVVIEDEAEVRDFLTNILEASYKVIPAENGVEGLAKIRQTNPDLVISDVMMPEMNGFELCNRVKSDADTCHIPVILLTALNDNENVTKGFEFRADDYISKPFSPKHLKARVEQLIENKHRLKAYFSKKSTIPDQHITMSSRDKNFLKQVILAIENNISDSNFGVEELAAEIHLSQSQFYRRLKQLTGQIPNVYLRNFRLQRAAELLKSNEGLNVAEVMYQIGIESNSYFSTSFKKLHGISPSEFIKRTACKV